MGSPNKSRVGVTDTALDGYASLERVISESPRSTSSSSTSTAFTERTYVDPRDTRSSIIPPPGAFVDMGNVKYATAEIKAMADAVTQARNTSELPPTQSLAVDAQAIIEDYTFLAQLRLARGDPALPPPEGYTRLRVEAARRIRERDARLGDQECKRAAAERVEGYLRVVGQEREYYDLAKSTAKRRSGDGVASEGAEGIVDEITAVVYRKVLDGSEGLRGTVGQTGMTAGALGSTADILDAVAGSVGRTSRTLDTTTPSLDTTSITLNPTATNLEDALGAMATQISTLGSQLLALTDTLQTRRAAPDTLTSPLAAHKPNTCLGLPQTANIEDTVRKEVGNALREAKIQAGAPCSPHSYGLLGADGGSSSMTDTSWDSHSGSASDDAAAKEKRESRTRSRRDSEKRTRRAGKYLRIVVDRILR